MYVSSKLLELFIEGWRDYQRWSHRLEQRSRGSMADWDSEYQSSSDEQSKSWP